MDLGGSVQTVRRCGMHKKFAQRRKVIRMQEQDYLAWVKPEEDNSSVWLGLGIFIVIIVICIGALVV